MSNDKKSEQPRYNGLEVWFCVIIGSVLEGVTQGELDRRHLLPSVILRGLLGVCIPVAFVLAYGWLRKWN